MDNNLKIRFAKPEDAEDMKRLIKEFRQEGLDAYNLSFDNDSLDLLIDIFCHSEICTVIVGLIDGQIKGIIAGTIQPSSFDRNEKLAEEKIWFVSKDARGTKLGTQMLDFFEYCVKTKGAKKLIMANMESINDGVMKRFYERRGYRELETHFIKNLEEVT